MSSASPRTRPRLSLSWPGRRRRPAHIRLGRRGERAARRFLRRHGYRILARNYRCSGGEVDLICADGVALVFVEVKTRTSVESQDPVDALRPPQWRRIHRAARQFMMHPAAAGRPARFDLITIVWPERGHPQIEHFPDAWRPVGP